MRRSVAILWMLPLVGACRCGASPPQERAWDPQPVQQVTTRFVGAPDVPLEPAVAFAAQARCPRIVRARLEALPPREGMEALARVTVEGERLGTVTRVGALLDDGKLAEVEPRAVGETLVLPVMCRRCEVVLGVPAPEAGGRVAACTGPGWSLRVEGGRLAD